MFHWIGSRMIPLSLHFRCSSNPRSRMSDVIERHRRKRKLNSGGHVLSLYLIQCLDGTRFDDSFLEMDLDFRLRFG